MPVEAVISTNCGARKVEAGAAAFWAAAGKVTRGESDTREESTKPRAAPRNTQHNRPCFTEDVAFTVPFQVRTNTFHYVLQDKLHHKTMVQNYHLIIRPPSRADENDSSLGADRLYHL